MVHCVDADGASQHERSRVFSGCESRNSPASDGSAIEPPSSPWIQQALKGMEALVKVCLS